MKKIDMLRKVFTRLTVKSCVGTNKWGQTLYSVICSCGTVFTVVGKNLRNGHTKSCGCLHRELLGMRNTLQRPHGMTRTPTHTSWSAMVQRCTDSKTADFKNYAGKIFDPWLNFNVFFSDMGERPKGTSLGRILDRGSYEPGNVFWMSQEEQNLSKRNNHALFKWEMRNKQICLT